ncbi:hypothetical protein BG53_10220 [Paenibacillus darwinianus]|uniref:EfeO-type cupredoxin-like domain-containing protein n=1 Tax=Paenibacillus darwinianus TaxID=1380763 RepID=A0A9W5W6E3_9BACL|nr:cupredoxin domain-containing protein [Paenibacillus darwinianus]EXX84873.1 hypothetical protein BG53_10220 [Paenibacillus darwinianus]EXX84972.1 hypothetical protein CH50_10405 [Paenibacillus darwinianus]EXX84999.1 hypothetical protein BG52_09365 [Paenibacillus darwinianus]
MSRIVVVSKNQLRMAAAIALIAVIVVAYMRWDQSRATSGVPSGQLVFQLVTGEFKSVGTDGKEIEAYRWDPGTIIVPRGETVQLNITGVNGASHPFVIEGLGVRDEVKKGQTTIVTFVAKKPGIYPIICLTHTVPAQGGPMVGYIVVQ